MKKSQKVSFPDFYCLQHFFEWFKKFTLDVKVITKSEFDAEKKKILYRIEVT